MIYSSQLRNENRQDTCSRKRVRRRMNAVAPKKACRNKQAMQGFSHEIQEFAKKIRCFKECVVPSGLFFRGQLRQVGYAGSNRQARRDVSVLGFLNLTFVVETIMV